jgi:hypothetical protein
MGNCSSTSNCNPCGPDFSAINQLAIKAGAYARQANTYAVNAENSWLEFNALYLGAFAVAPTVDNEGDPLQVGALYWNTGTSLLYVWNGATWVVTNSFNEFTPFLATNTIEARNLVTRFSEEINVKDFGAIGDGLSHPLSSKYATLAAAQVDYPFATSLTEQLDWAAINKSILTAYTLSPNNYKPRVYIPAGDYLIDRLEINSVRGVSIVGEQNQDHTKNKTVLRYVGGPGDAAVVIKSCAYVNFQGIRFDINNVSGLNSLVQFQGNAFNAISPLNRFSSRNVNFFDCVFIVLTGIGVPPAQTIWLKDAGGSNFERCVIRAGDSLVAVKIGADSSTDPVTGLPTFADGMATTPSFFQTLFYGQIQREKSRQLVCDGCDFASAANIPGGQPSRITVSGNGETTNELFINCGWDTVTVGSTTGILIDGGTNLGANPPPCNMTIENCQLGGGAVLVQCNKGDLTVRNCRGLPDSNITSNEFIRMQAGSGSLIAENNNGEQYVEGANSVAPPTLRADYIRDLRATDKKMPILGSIFLSSNQTFAALNTFEDVLTTPNYFFGGQYVRLTYSLTVKHLTGANPSNYIARLYYGSTNINETSRTITLSDLNQFGVISCSYVFFVPVQSAAMPIILKAQQSAGGGVTLGQIQGNSTAQTTLSVEILNY